MTEEPGNPESRAIHINKGHCYFFLICKGKIYISLRISNISVGMLGSRYIKINMMSGVVNLI